MTLAAWRLLRERSACLTSARGAEASELRLEALLVREQFPSSGLLKRQFRADQGLDEFETVSRDPRAGNERLGHWPLKRSVVYQRYPRN
ncbi:MAG: hypothetical protein Q9187_005595 [Circinaria calcarea]